MALYTDRAGWAFHTPTAGGRVDGRTSRRRPHLGPPRHRPHPELLAPGPRPGRAPQPHPPGPSDQRAPRGGDHHLEAPMLPARAVPPRLHTQFTRRRPIRPAPSCRWATRWTSISSSPTRQSASSAATMWSASRGVPCSCAKQRGGEAARGCASPCGTTLAGEHTVWRGPQCLGRYDATAAPGRPAPAGPEAPAAPSRGHPASRPRTHARIWLRTQVSGPPIRDIPRTVAVAPPARPRLPVGPGE